MGICKHPVAGLEESFLNHLKHDFCERSMSNPSTSCLTALSRHPQLVPLFYFSKQGTAGTSARVSVVVSQLELPDFPGSTRESAVSLKPQPLKQRKEITGSSNMRGTDGPPGQIGKKWLKTLAIMSFFFSPRRSHLQLKVVF